jgi:hypothetical protein
MWPKSWITGRADVLHELESWRGATAQAWAYSVSHSQFLVRLYREEDLKGSPLVSLYLYLKVCDRVSFVGIWRDASIQIAERAGKYGREFVVSDGDRLRIECGAVFAAASTEMVRFEGGV